MTNNDDLKQVRASAVAALINDVDLRFAEYEISDKIRKSLSGSLKREAEASRPGRVQWTLWMLDYHPSHVVKNLDDFKPFYIFNDGSSSQPFLRDLPIECLNWYQDLVEHVANPRIKARLLHILFLRRHGRSDIHAKGAASAYREVARHLGPEIFSVEATANSLELSLSVRNMQGIQESFDLCVHLIEALINEPEPAPGVLLNLIGTLIKSDTHGLQVDSFLAKARELYINNSRHEDSVINFQIDRARKDNRAVSNLWIERVNLWINEADSSDPLLASHYLSTAIDHARSSNDKSLLETATKKLQENRLKKFGFANFSASVAVSRARLEKVLEPITSASSWQDALTAIVDLGPITGDYQSNIKEVERNLIEFPLSKIFPPVLCGNDNLPRYKPDSEEEIKDYSLVRNDLTRIDINSMLVLEAFVRTIAKYSVPSLDDMTRFLTSSPVVNLSLGQAIARSLLRFWSGDAESAVFTIVPRIEALVRNILLVLDSGIYETQHNKSPGQYPPLRFMLNKLPAKGLDKSWHRYIDVVCCHVAGLNIRNELSHGFLDNGSEALAAMLLQIVLKLSLLKFDGDKDEVN